MSSVDVIVPCYRYGHFLRQCVESVLTQSLRDLRVLIIDDASPDDTARVAAELVKKDARVSFIRHRANQGHIATYNEGIEWTASEYALLLSADDYLLPDALRRAVDLMDAHPEVGFTFGRAITLKDGEAPADGGPLTGADHADQRVLGGLTFIELSGCRSLVPTATAVVRTALQKRLGGYCPELPHSGDLEMWLRLAAHASVGMLEANQAVYRRHGRNMSLDYTNGLLPDVQQRKAALDRFLQSCHDVLPDAQRLERRLFLSLARDAVGFASETFNRGETAVSEQLAAFARALSPDVVKTSGWKALACKRHLGLGTWLVVQPMVSGVRRMATRLGPMTMRSMRDLPLCRTNPEPSSGRRTADGV